MTRRVEEIPTVRRIDIKEDTRNHNCLLLEKFFEKGLNLEI